MTSSKMPFTLYRQRRTFNKSFPKGKTRHCKSIAERIREQKLELLIKPLSEKNDKFSSFWYWTSPTRGVLIT